MDDSNAALKSILKDIASALQAQSTIEKALPVMIEQQVKKSFDQMLRKQGFQVTHPDVTRFNPDVSKSGLDTVSEIKKAEDKVDAVEGDIMKSDVQKEQDLVKAIDDLSKVDWRKLGQIREKAGLFRPFDQ